MKVRARYWVHLIKEGPDTQRNTERKLLSVGKLSKHTPYVSINTLPILLILQVISIYKQGLVVDDLVHCGPVLHSPLSDAL